MESVCDNTQQHRTYRFYTKDRGGLGVSFFFSRWLQEYYGKIKTLLLHLLLGQITVTEISTHLSSQAWTSWVFFFFVFFFTFMALNYLQSKRPLWLPYQSISYKYHLNLRTKYRHWITWWDWAWYRSQYVSLVSVFSCPFAIQ